MTKGHGRFVWKQVLLRDVGDICRLRIFCVEMVIGLFFPRPDLFRNGEPPFLGIRELRVYIEDQSAKWIKPVPYNLANRELGMFDVAHGINVRQPYRRCKSGGD